MKKLIKFISITLITVLMSSLVWPVSAGSDAAQANRNNPVKAENVELVKKVTLKGAPAKPDKVTGTAATGILGSPLPDGGKKYALVIGISDYPGTGSDLSYGDDDADAVTNVLMTKYGFSRENIAELTDSTATRSAINTEVSRLKALMGKNDELVFFFSGHGAKGKADDGDRSNVDQSIVIWAGTENQGFGYIWDNELKTMFSTFNPECRIVFIFDSCLSGGMSVLKSANRIVDMACTANGLSYEGAQWNGGQGQFTYYFAMEGLGAGKADTYKADGKVTIEEAFDYSKANCIWQTPTIADGFENDLLLN